MTGKEVVVVAVMCAKKGQEEVLEHELRALITPTRKEKGCINYDLHRSADNRAEFLFHETWTSSDALQEHLKSDHLAKFLRNVESVLARPPEIKLWEKIA